MRDQISRIGKCRTGKCRTENAGLENAGSKIQEWKMQEQKMRDQFHFVILILKNAKMCCAILHLYYLMLECIDYFVTAVVTSAFN